LGSKIPVLGVPGLSLSYNGYLYVHGNPVNLTAPSGQIIPIAAIILGAAAGRWRPSRRCVRPG
jgi:hypothetical protein